LDPRDAFILCLGLKMRKLLQVRLRVGANLHKKMKAVDLLLFLLQQLDVDGLLNARFRI
jgi:hypothetical protein